MISHFRFCFSFWPKIKFYFWHIFAFGRKRTSHLRSVSTAGQKWARNKHDRLHLDQQQHPLLAACCTSCKRKCVLKGWRVLIVQLCMSNFGKWAITRENLGLGHSVSIQQIFCNFPARPSQNLMQFAGSFHLIFKRKCTKFQDDIFSSFWDMCIYKGPMLVRFCAILGQRIIFQWFGWL